MNWMFEPRSNYYDHDDAGGGDYMPSIKWYELPLLPLVVFSFMVLFAVLGIFAFLYIFTHDFYSTVKRVSESGKLEFPVLVFTGIAITIILPILISNHLLDALDNPFIIFCPSFFVLLFTLAPLTGLVLRHFKHPKQ